MWETRRQVFQWILAFLAGTGLVKAKRIGIDATTLEANAALRSDRASRDCGKLGIDRNTTGGHVALSVTRTFGANYRRSIIQDQDLTRPANLRNASENSTAASAGFGTYRVFLTCKHPGGRPALTWGKVSSRNFRQEIIAMGMFNVNRREPLTTPDDPFDQFPRAPRGRHRTPHRAVRRYR